MKVFFQPVVCVSTMIHKPAKNGQISLPMYEKSAFARNFCTQLHTNVHPFMCRSLFFVNLCLCFGAWWTNWIRECKFFQVSAEVKCSEYWINQKCSALVSPCAFGKHQLPKIMSPQLNLDSGDCAGNVLSSSRDSWGKFLRWKHGNILESDVQWSVLRLSSETNWEYKRRSILFKNKDDVIPWLISCIELDQVGMVQTIHDLDLILHHVLPETRTHRQKQTNRHRCAHTHTDTMRCVSCSLLWNKASSLLGQIFLT